MACEVDGVDEAGHHELADVVQQRRGRRLGRRAGRGARSASSSAASDAATEWLQSSPSARPYSGTRGVEPGPNVHAERERQHRARAQPDDRVLDAS